MRVSLSELCAASLGALLLAGAHAPAAQRRGARASARQSEFGMEVPIRRAVKVPRDVLRQMADSQRREDSGAAGGPAPLARDARGSLVNLDDDGRDDLLVQADPGANVTGFWLFRNAGGRWRLVLHAVALNLSVERRRTRGLRDVSVEALSAVKGWGATYKFDGERYRPADCWERDLGVGRNGEWGPPRRIRCGDDAKPYR